ncbi:hypothetical protein P3T73_10120 [Kiritimatiellota bacterium B12222]|nr:hypothetical protein P3T73_10120 [Kiritimatiellota bacterium B12222]
MNEYRKASLITHGAPYLIFMGLPVVILAATDTRQNAAHILLWFCGVFMCAMLTAIVVGIVNQRLKRVSWAAVYTEAFSVLLVASIGGAFPTFWNENSREFITMGGWIFVCGIIPTILTGVLHYGSLEKIIDIENAEPCSGENASRPTA